MNVGQQYRRRVRGHEPSHPHVRAAYVLHLYGTHAGTYLLRVRSGPHAEHVEDLTPRSVAEGEWHRYGLLVLPAAGVAFFDPGTGP